MNNNRLWAVMPSFVFAEAEDNRPQPTIDDAARCSLALDLEPSGPAESAYPSFTYDIYDRVAMLEINGPITRGWSPRGGTSSRAFANSLNRAVNDTNVDSIFISIDSPGGAVDGTEQAARELEAAAKVKPVVAFVDSLSASAAYWMSANATSIIADPASELGSLGVFAVVADVSKAMEKRGISFHVVATGDHKGTLVPGMEVNEEALADLRASVDFYGSLFRERVAAGRKLEDVDSIFDGRVFSAPKAVELGLADALGDFRSAFATAKRLGAERTRRSTKHLFL